MKKEENNQVDILEQAADMMEVVADVELVQDSLAPRESFHQDVGVVIGLNLAAQAMGKVALEKFFRLSQNKEYKNFGYKNLKELGQRCGIPSFASTKRLKEQLDQFGLAGFKALTAAKLKQKDMLLLAKAKDTIKVDDETIAVGETIVDLKDETAVKAVLKRLEREKKEAEKKKDAAKEEIETLRKERDELKDSLIEGTLRPEKAVQEATSITGKFQKDFLAMISQLRKLIELNNDQITEIVAETILYCEGLLVPLKQIFMDMPSDNEGLMSPDDVIDSFGEEPQDDEKED